MLLKYEIILSNDGFDPSKDFFKAINYVTNFWYLKLKLDYKTTMQTSSLTLP